MFITVKEACQKTGYAPGTIRSLVSRGYVQSLKEKRNLFVCLKDLQEYMGRPRVRRKKSSNSFSLLEELKKQCQEANRIISYLTNELCKANELIKVLMECNPNVVAM